MADDAEKPGQLNHLKVRRWKIAIPVAVVGAIAAPFVFGTWKMPQTSETWVPLTADQKAKLDIYMQNTENCRTFEAASGDNRGRISVSISLYPKIFRAELRGRTRCVHRGL
jgi:hypothetical protein